MRHVDGKAERALASAMLQIAVHDQRVPCWRVHDAGQCLFLKILAAHAHAIERGPGRDTHPTQVDEKSLHDEVEHGPRIGQFLEDGRERTRFALAPGAERRRGQSQMPVSRVALSNGVVNLLPHRRFRVMGFVGNHQADAGQAVKVAHQGRHGRDHNGPVELSSFLLDHTDLGTLPRETDLLDGLPQDFVARHEDKHGLARAYIPAARHLGANQGLASTRWERDQQGAQTCCPISEHGVDGFSLEGEKRHHGYSSIAPASRGLCDPIARGAR